MSLALESGPKTVTESANKLFPKGLANSSGLVGNLMLHPLGFVEGTFNQYIEFLKVQRDVAYLVMSFMIL